MSDQIEIYDTTLRDGMQGESVNFSVPDKCRVVEQLDALGVDFIEGGWPGSNPRDVAFFEQVRALKLCNGRIAAFGATRRSSLTCDAEHFFDGYRADPGYALETVRQAAAAGARRIVLCDTNGGSLPDDVAYATRHVIQEVNIALGIHCHNDGDLAVANTLAAVSAGAI